MKQFQKDTLQVYACDTRAEMGKWAADRCELFIKQLLADRDEINIIFAAAPSQNDMLAELIARDIDFSRINAYHMDEYVGLKPTDKQSFATYLTEHLFSKVGFGAFHDITVGAYKIMNRLDDVPLVTGYDHKNPQSCAPFQDLFSLGYQSAAVGYCFGENGDHMATPDIPDIETRNAKAEVGADLICKMVERMNMPHVVEQLRKLEEYGLENEKKYPWMPSAWNRNR